jgi:hypothetical protein
MDFQTLRTFVEVVREGGFSQAAKVVFTTQSTDHVGGLRLVKPPRGMVGRII